MRKQTIYLYFSCIFFIYSCSGTDREIKERVSEKNIPKEILLQPEKGKRIMLSSIIDDIHIIPLETTEGSFISSILKIDRDSGIYFILNAYDKFVYTFDDQGRFIRRISNKGPGPKEIQHPGTFSLNKKSKEIWLTDNFYFLSQFD